MSTTERASHFDAMWMINYTAWLKHLSFACKTILEKYTFVYRQSNVNWCATAGAVYQLLDGSKRAWDEWEMCPVAAFPWWFDILSVDQKEEYTTVKKVQEE